LKREKISGVLDRQIIATVPKCEECVSHQPSEIIHMSDICRNVGRIYVYCANERMVDGNCGPTARLFKRRAG
jgi:hypothetical protein